MRLIFVLIVVIHYVIFVSLLASTILCWFDFPWYMCLLILTIVFRIGMSREECPLTSIENLVRRKLNMPKSTGFLKDWIIRPIKGVYHE